MFNALLYKKYPFLFRQRIQRSPAWNYYIIISGGITMLAGFIFQHKLLFITGALLYLGFTAAFIAKRLIQTSRSPEHILEMVATSMVIPFISVYWTLYGSIKYRVLYY
jgi:hypothetical protein